MLIGMSLKKSTQADESHHHHSFNGMKVYVALNRASLLDAIFIVAQSQWISLPDYH